LNHVGPASIVINNHNYGRFLRDAIDSALSQSYPQTEVIVVDDGSTDHSREIIAEYGDRVVPLLKENGGQPSAFNSGFRMSRGDVIVFLDADDLLAASAVEQAMKLFVTGDVAKVHWPLRDIDGHGRETGDVTPRRPLPEGDLREGVVRDGPEAYLSAPTTGNAWARTFLQKVLPLPEIDGYRYGGADVYLSTLAPLFGRVKALAQPQGCYRLHGENNYARLHFDEKFQQDLWCYDNRCEALSRHCREMGLDVNPDAWKRNSWLHRFPQAREEIAERIPLGESLILVDQEELGSAVAPWCNTIPFLERDGRY
jgi:glycosyltransferase involved in cell wall biosynthesis